MLQIYGWVLIFGVPRPPEAIPGRNGGNKISISPPGSGPMYAIIYPDFCYLGIWGASGPQRGGDQKFFLNFDRFGPPGPRDPLQRLGRIGGNRSPLFPSKSVVIGPIFGQNNGFWPPRAPGPPLKIGGGGPPRATGPTATPRAHRGEPIPPVPVEIRGIRTNVWPT